VVITRTSTYGTGFQGYLKYGNGTTSSTLGFMTGLNSSYISLPLTNVSGVITTYAGVSSNIISTYLSVIGRYPDSAAFDGWINEFRFNPIYTSISVLVNTIIRAYQNDGEQAFQIANGGLVGNYDNCNTKRA
jgi:hypothetical protein